MRKPKTIINDKFKPLFVEDSRYFLITGGRGSSKSFSVSVFLLMLIHSQRNEKVLFTRKTLTSASISIIPEFQDKIDIMGLNGEFEIKNTEITSKRTGSQILFKGLQSSSKDNTANLKSLQGVTNWVLDEAEELTDEDTFDRIDLSIRKKDIQNRVILIMNPTTKEHFIYRRFFESKGIQEGSNTTKDNCTYIHTTYLDNKKNLNQSFIDRANDLRKNRPEKYKHIILGGWLEKAEGVIFTNWQIGEFQQVSASMFGQDFGFSVDPTTLVEISVDKSQKKIYAKEHLYKTGLVTSEIADINNRVTQGKLIVGDSAEPRLIEELSLKGNNIEGAEKGKGSINAGIALINDYELIVSPDSVNLIKELNNYAWSDRKRSTPVDAYNHLLDALRYACSRYLEVKQETFLF